MGIINENVDKVDIRVKQKKKDLIDYFIREREGSNIKNREVFSLEYIPKEIYHREDYIFWLLEKMGNIDRFRNNLNIWGPVGCGKTLVVKYSISHLQDMWKDLNITAKIVYVNCNEYSTSSSVLYKIITSLGGEVAERGLRLGTYIAHLKEIIEDLTALVICLDEVDFLITRRRNKKKGYEEVLYSFGEINKINLICISNIPKWNQFLDDRIRSRLQLENKNFAAYSESETRDIILQRIELGLKDSKIFSDKHIDYIVKTILINKTDIRDAIRYLQIIVDYLDKNEVEVSKHILNKCYNILIEEELFSTINSLSIAHKILIWIISSLAIKKKKITSNLINTRWNELASNDKFEYKEYIKPIGVRQIQRHINTLTELYQLLSSNTASLGRYGKENVITPEFDAELVHDHYKLDDRINSSI